MLTSPNFSKTNSIKNHLFDEQEYVFQERIFNDFSSGHLSYRQWLDKWAISWGKAFKGLQQSEVLLVAKDVFQKAKRDLFSFSHQLIEYFTNKSYKTLIISAGASEVIELFSQHLGAQFSIATKLEIKEGKYTGNMLSNIHTSEGKGESLRAFLNNNGLTKPDFAFGDSVGDLAILEQAICPIALNADNELAPIAIEKGWPVKNSKKCYELFNFFVISLFRRKVQRYSGEVYSCNDLRTGRIKR